jgi:hypothetical protein
MTRVGAPDVPMPFNDRLERAVIPSAERIVAAVKALFGQGVGLHWTSPGFPRHWRGYRAATQN